MKKLSAGLSLLLLVILVAGYSDVQAEEFRWAESGLQLLDSTPDAITIDYTLPGFRLETETLDGQAYNLLHVDGAGLTSVVGQPQLPVRGVLVGIPPGAEVVVTLLEVETQTLQGRYHIRPVPTDNPGQEAIMPAPGAIEPLAAPSTVRVWVPDPEIYGASAFFPEHPVELVGVGTIRHQRVALIRLNPAQFNPVSGAVRLVSHLSFRLSFQYPDGREAESLSDGPEPGGFEELLSTYLINYESARNWRMAPSGPSFGPVAAFQPPGSGEAYKISVAESGIYEITYEDLETAGLPASTLDPQKLQVFNMGSEVPLYVDLGANGVLDTGDSILFYGEAFEDKYTALNVYWLVYGHEDGLRMTPADGHSPGGLPTPTCFATEVHAEDNVWRHSLLDVPEVDFERWLWMFATAPASMTGTVSLANLCPSGSATITVSVFGETDDPAVIEDHEIDLYVNGYHVGNTQWAGRTRNISSFTFDQSLLKEGSNDVRFTGVLSPGATIDSVNMLDWFELGYSHAYRADGDRLVFWGDAPGAWEYQVGGFTSGDLELYDVTDPHAVRRFEGFAPDPTGATYTLRFSDTVVADTRYLAQTTAQRVDVQPGDIVHDSPSTLKATTNGADWIVISPAAFATQAQRLANYRASQGLRAIAVDLQDVYDEFNYGRANIHAIHDFLEYAYTYWMQPAPSYVVLLGDGTDDYKDYLGLYPDSVNYLSPYLAPVDPHMDYPRYEIMGETAADNRYVAFGEDDIFPDMHLGRLPANSLASAQAMVDKIIAYEGAPAGDWMSKVMFVADNPEVGNDFFYYSNDLVDNHLPMPPYQPTKVYVGQTCSTTTLCRQAVQDGYNAGHLIVNYIGHASVQYWAGEKLLHVNDVPLLDNPDTLPINLAMGCYDGAYYYAVPTYQGLAETIVRAAGKGAIASWSATSQGLAAGHEYLDRGFFDAVFQQDVRELGLATYYGKLELWDQAGFSYPDLIDTFLLFGDPALHINALDPDLQIQKTVEPTGQVEPGETLIYTLTFNNAGLGPAHNVTLTDILPPQLVNPTVLYASPEVLTQAVGVTYAWDIADLDPGAGGTIQIQATVAPTLTQGVVVNEAEISSPLSGDSASVTTGINVPDLFVTKTGPAQATFGQTITYTITWGHRETGQVAATGVRLTDTLPQWVEYVSDDSGLVATPDPVTHQVVWMVPGEVPIGTQESFVLTAEVAVDPGAVGPLLNQVGIASSLPDGNPEDDHSQWATSIVEGKLYTYLPLVRRATPPGPLPTGSR